MNATTADLIAEYRSLGIGDEARIMKINEELSRRSDRFDLLAVEFFGPLAPDE